MTQERFSAWDWTVLVFLFLMLPSFVLDLLGNIANGEEQVLASLFLTGIAMYGIVKWIKKLIRSRRKQADEN